MQELFLRLTRARGFEKADSLYAYAWKAAANLAFGWHRQQRRDVCFLEAAEPASETSDGTLEKMIKEEQFRRVLQVTATLRELPRNIIVMRYIEEKSYEEIADRLGKNTGHIRSLCSKTLNRLRDRLNVRESDHTEREVCCE
jgi:RNA polymerase sigma-70 factor (ECF subfamily)